MTKKIMPPQNERLALFFKLAGLKQTAAASILGIKQQTVSQILNGQSGISDQVLRALELQFDLNPDWIRSGVGSMVYPEGERQPRQPLKLARIPILREIPAGEWKDWSSLIPASLIEGFIDIPSLSRKEYFAVIMNDSQMQPRINKGDVIIIDPNTGINELAVIRRNGGFTLRGLQRKGNDYRFRLLALNPDKHFKEEEIIPDNETVLYAPVKVVSVRDI